MSTTPTLADVLAHLDALSAKVDQLSAAVLAAEVGGLAGDKRARPLRGVLTIMFNSVSLLLRKTDALAAQVTELARVVDGGQVKQQ